MNATILHVVISQPGDDSQPPVRPWFGTFFDRRSMNAAELKKLIPYLRRCNFMLQAGEPHDARPDVRILPDGTVIRFTEDSLFEVSDPTGRVEFWDPVTGEKHRTDEVGGKASPASYSTCDMPSGRRGSRR